MPEIMKIVSLLKETTTSYDDINGVFTGMFAEFIYNLLAHIYNLSISGVFQNSIRIANVIPLHMSDDPMCPENYPPVSLFCVLSKVFER